MNLFSSNTTNLILRLIREHIKPYYKLFALALTFMIIAAASTAALPFLLKPVFDDVFAHGTPQMLTIFCGAVFFAFSLKGAASYGESVVMTYVGQKIISDIQKRLFSHLMKCDLEFFHKVTSGELLSHLTNDVNMMRNAVSNTLIGLGKDSFTLFFLIFIMFYRDFKLAVIAFFIFPSIVIPIARVGRSMRKVTHSTQDELAKFTTSLTQIFQGIRVVKAYGMERHESNRIGDKINHIFKLIYKSARVRSASHPIVETLGGLAIVCVIAYGGWQVMHHNRTTGEFISFITALLLIYEPLKRLCNLNANVQEGLTSAKRVFKLIDTKPSIISSKESNQNQLLQGNIHFKNVTFQYPDGKIALKNITFEIQSGKNIAFVGPSGSGKSTLINLIARFYDINSGSISIDGMNIQSMDINFLRKSLSLVSQEILLFDMSVKENIHYGSLNSDDNAIENASKLAAAHSFIKKLPYEYETQIGENGVKLSGGQRQRIAIARAMLKNAPILLLDEATSALDSDSEKQVQFALKNLMQKKTTISVAHRLSTIVECDCIYVLDQGEIVESGNHKQLLEQSGVYKRLWLAQSQPSI